MKSDATPKLRLDRRLIQRRGWISPQELESEIEALPDVSDKLTTLGEAEDEAKDDTKTGGDRPAD